MSRFALGNLLVLCIGSGYATASEPQDQKVLLTTFRDEFVSITPGVGKFPEPKQKQAPFAIAKYEITQNLYASVMGRNPSRWKGPRNSVESITYIEATTFCDRITAIMRRGGLLNDNEVIRLPTESEWEYACRAGTKTDYSFGANPRAKTDKEPAASVLDDYAWHHGNAAGNDPAVGVLKPNPWGLYDMHGYLWEYVSDPWRPAQSAATAAELPGSTQRTMRGGSWRDHYSMLKSSTRWAVPDHIRSDAIGFRCVKATVPQRKAK
ncbi:MAG: formylglycine-generating enzyme family protein [Planctomycetaceae bacterium]